MMHLNNICINYTHNITKTLLIKEIRENLVLYNPLLRSQKNLKNPNTIERDQ